MTKAWGALDGSALFGPVPNPHRHDHSRLLKPFDVPPERGRVDAVIVPSRRPPTMLRTAARVARKLDVPLVVLTSKSWSEEEAHEVLDGRPGAVVPLGARVRRPFFRLSVAQLSDTRRNPHADTAAKRNVGLRLARRLGWRRVLFLDDDVVDLPRSQVLAAAGAMEGAGLRAVGWALADFPDNSVICHLRREVRLEQGIFIGGGALLVDTLGEVPFFPPVYNEDWLFLHDPVREGRVTMAGEVGQEAFNPFKVRRARREEFGDILAEGLFGLIHAERPVEEALSADLWHEVLRGRAVMLQEVRERMTLLFAGPGVPARRRRTFERCWQASVEECTSFAPSLFTAYVRAWRDDQDRWVEQLAELEGTGDDLGTALKFENLTGAHVSG
ncbi:hypothetical protein ACIB24_13515 [Spongisporangium articulatum]|uniref:Uncharacterized protein n=1 Tax=Spongisporangium articulatum TaxID=3362603 RepID=A0ABW8AR16_9ACTN